MTVLTPFEGGSLFVIFAITMLGLVFFKTRQEKHADGFLVADRDVSIWRGAFSIAVSWIWAPAIFICSLQAYSRGLPGVFWFVAPNILCFFVFAFVAVRVRKLIPNGYTLPDFIWIRFGKNKVVHLAFLLIFFAYQVGAVIINAVAGGALLNLVSGIDIAAAIIGMVAVALAYSLFSGLKASVFTDFIQMSLILVVGFVLVPWSIMKAGGIDSVASGLSGITGENGFLFDPHIAWLMGIPMTIALISGPIGDQMFYQRAMAVRQKDIVQVFVRGGILFGLVPTVLSLLGFVGVTLVHEHGLIVEDPQLIGAMVVAELLPKWALYLFCLMALSGLCSTLDSAFCAASSLGSVDIYRRYINKRPTDSEMLRVARIVMLIVGVIGTGIALLQPQLIWMFFINGMTTAIGLFPIVFALYWSRLSGKAVFGAIILSFLIVVPLNIYANVNGDENLVVIAALLGIGIGLFICLLAGLLFPDKKFRYDDLPQRKNLFEAAP